MPGTAGETAGEMTARLGTNAILWAEEMQRVLLERDGVYLDPEPGELLHVWLCNAIEAGRSAGYAAGRDASATLALKLARELEADGDPVRADVAGDIRDRLTGWPLPANLAASELPANPAASDLPENLAGSYEFPRHMERIAEALERLASVVAPTSSVWAAPSLRVEPLS